MNARIRGALVGVAVVVAALGGGEALSKPPAVVPSNAEPLTSVPAHVVAITNGRNRADAPAFSCTAVSGARWYTVTAPRRGPMVAKLLARGELDGAIVVYRVVRSQRMPVACAATNRHGRARLAWYAHTDGSYLIGVARRVSSAAGQYELSVLAADRPDTAPGTALPAEGVAGTVNAILDRADAYAVTMHSGTTYRLNLTKPSRFGCIGYRVFRPGIPSFLHAKAVFARECGGYAEFTPGADGGGLYSVLVSTDGTDALDHAYRLQVAAAEPDDTAPGIKLENGEFVSGTLLGRGVDDLDMYRFAVSRANEQTTVELHQKANVGFDVLILREGGNRVATIPGSHGLQVLRLQLPAGWYYAVVRSHAGNGGQYVLQVRVRDVTSTHITAGGASNVQAPPTTALPLTVHVDSASHGGRVLLEIDHFDPLFGWHFAQLVPGQLDAAGSFTSQWMPSSVGQFRARARFVANPYSSFSESGYVHMHVVDPLE